MRLSAQCRAIFAVMKSDPANRDAQRGWIDDVHFPGSHFNFVQLSSAPNQESNSTKKRLCRWVKRARRSQLDDEERFPKRQRDIPIASHEKCCQNLQAWEEAYSRIREIGENLAPTCRARAGRILLILSRHMVGTLPALDLPVGPVGFAKDAGCFGEDGVVRPDCVADEPRRERHACR